MLITLRRTSSVGSDKYIQLPKLLGILPFRGQEFGFIGIAILLTAIAYTTKKINQPFTCFVKNQK
jgi:hypothetical protein